jgi:subtilisin family serine protease
VDADEHGPTTGPARAATLHHVGQARTCRLIDAGTADDELFVYQFAMRMLGAEKAWSWIRQIRSSDILTAIIDNGVDLDHPDLAGQLVPGKDFPCVTPECNGGSPDGVHGTAMAGIVAAARYNGGMIGTAWNTQLLPIRISSNAETTSEMAAVDAVRYAVSRGARVINFSYASNEPTESLRELLLGLPGNFLFVVAAGNDGMQSSGRIYPASYSIPRMVVVTSHDVRGNPDGAIGADAQIDIAAPGDAVYPIPCKPSASGKCYEIDGASTSNAAAYVSGAAALLWSAHPYWSAASIKRRILETADPEPKLARVMQQPRRLNLARMMEPD